MGSLERKVVVTFDEIYNNGECLKFNYIELQGNVKNGCEIPKYKQLYYNSCRLNWLRFRNLTLHFQAPTVPDQNQGLPVYFKLKSVGKGHLLFLNSHHDFPQRIYYRLLSPDSLVAEISGI